MRNCGHGVPDLGVEVFPLVPIAVGFLIAGMATPAGVSGAFLLLPFQLSVLGFTSPGVTPTNLIYNIVSTPGGIFRYRRQGGIDLVLVKAICLGALPAVAAGAVLRVTVLSQVEDFKIFVGIVLAFLGANLLLQVRFSSGREMPVAHDLPTAKIVALAAGAGLIGGIYGISGGSIIAPVLAGLFRLPVKRVAPAALFATLITSIVGVTSFEILHLVDASGAGTRPDWTLAVLFGAGGICGGYAGAALNKKAPEVALRVLLGVLALLLAATYIAPAL